MDPNCDKSSSVECLDDEHFEKHIENKTQSACKSLFNFSLDEAKSVEKNLEYKDYEKRLIDEMKDWKALFFEAYQDRKKSQQPHPIIDKSILPPEKLNYLNQAVCLQRFLRESVEFRQEANVFMDYYYAQNKEMMENLEDICVQRLNLIKANKLEVNKIIHNSKSMSND